MSFKIAILLIVLIFFQLTGCVSQGEGKLIKADIKKLEMEYKTLKVSVQDNKNAIDRSIKRIDVKVAELDKTLSKAKTLLQKNNANFGQDVVLMDNNIRKLKGKNEELLHIIDQLKSQVEDLKISFEQLQGNVSVSTNNGDQNKDQNSDENNDNKSDKTDQKEEKLNYKEMKDPNKMFRYGYNFILNKDYKKSREVFTYLIKKFPRDSRAISAKYWTTQTYFAENNYKKAFIEMNKFVNKYPKNSNIPQILYQMGYCAKSLKLTSDSIDIFKHLIKNYPSSSYSKKAKELLKEMK